MDRSGVWKSGRSSPLRLWRPGHCAWQRRPRLRRVSVGAFGRHRCGHQTGNRTEQGISPEHPAAKILAPPTQAAIELQLKNPVEAIRILQPVEPMDLSLSFPLDFGAMYTTYLRGEAYLQLHQGKEAAAQFQKILDHPGVVINFALGSLAHLGLARAYALDGDKAKSRAAYDHFLELWKDGDAENHVLRQARYERGPQI